MKVRWSISAAAEIPDPPEDKDPLVAAQEFVATLSAALGRAGGGQINEVSVQVPAELFERYQERGETG